MYGIAHASSFRSSGTGSPCVRTSSRTCSRNSLRPRPIGSECDERDATAVSILSISWVADIGMRPALFRPVFFQAERRNSRGNGNALTTDPKAPPVATVQFLVLASFAAGTDPASPNRGQQPPSYQRGFDCGTSILADREHILHPRTVVLVLSEAVLVLVLDFGWEHGKGLGVNGRLGGLPRGFEYE